MNIDGSFSFINQVPQRYTIDAQAHLVAIFFRTELPFMARIRFGIEGNQLGPDGRPVVQLIPIPQNNFQILLHGDEPVLPENPNEYIFAWPFPYDIIMTDNLGVQRTRRLTRQVQCAWFRDYW